MRGGRERRKERRGRESGGGEAGGGGGGEGERLDLEGKKNKGELVRLTQRVGQSIKCSLDSDDSSSNLRIT